MTNPCPIFIVGQGSCFCDANDRMCQEPGSLIELACISHDRIIVEPVICTQVSKCLYHRVIVQHVLCIECKCCKIVDMTEPADECCFCLCSNDHDWSVRRIDRQLKRLLPAL